VVDNAVPVRDDNELLSSFNVATFKNQEDDATFWSRLIPSNDGRVDDGGVRGRAAGLAGWLAGWQAATAAAAAGPAGKALGAGV
jgi:hypothetical protein